MYIILNFIFGRSGSGKTAKLNEIIKNKLKLGKEKIIFMVPEQNSFEKENSMLEFLGNKDFNKIKVLSFSRLYDYISEILKIPKFNFANDALQIVMANEAIELSKPKLKIYKKSCANIELAEMVLNVIHDLKSNKIKIETLKDIYSKCKSSILKQKIEEIINIYESYKTVVNDSFIDTFDGLNKLEDIIKSSNIFNDDYIFFFDEFSNFTAQQFSIIEQILKQSKDVYMTFCTDNSKPDLSESNLFLTVDNAVSKIIKIANENNMQINTTKLENKNFRAKNDELKILEENIFRPKKDIFRQKPENIFIYGAVNIHEESEFVARTIRKLIIQENYKYKDFTVLTRNIDSYKNSLVSSFKRYDIPFFMDFPEKLYNKNLTNFILSAFDIIHENFDKSDIFRYLKTGLSGFTYEEISIIENYALMWDIKADLWFKDFDMHPGGYYKEFDEESTQLLEKINDIRRKFIEPIEKFKRKILKSTGKEISIAIYELLEDVNVAENLKKFCVELEKSEYQAAQKYALIWDTIIQVLNQVTKIIGNKKISSRKYLEVLNLAINFVDFSDIPQCLDNVTLASAQRSYIPNAKVVFLVGVSNGEFPQNPNSSEIFTDQEISHISSLGVDFNSKLIKNFLSKERFLAYKAVSTASEKLFVSWSFSEPFKESKFPSEIIKEILKIFPETRILSDDNFSYEDFILSKNSAFEIYAKTRPSPSVLNSSLRKILYSDEKYKNKCDCLETYLDKNRLNFKNSENIFLKESKNIKFSASQIEKFYNCKFSYFCEYLLKAKPSFKASFGAMDYGNVMHYIFEKILKNDLVKNQNNISENDLKIRISKILEQYVSEKFGGFSNKTSFFLYSIEKIKKLSLFLIKHILLEFKQCEFEILGSEIEISNKGNINPLCFDGPYNKKITIEGKIDRADIFKKDNCNFVRIIDYKTGKKQFKLSDVLSGIGMQMLIYLLAVAKNGIKNYENIVPAGMLYFTAIKPIIESNGNESYEKLESEIKKKLKMSGLIINNKNVVLAMEKEAKGEFIPATLKNDEVKIDESVINLDDLEIIYKYIKRLIKNMARDLFDGNFSTNPMESSCKWCSYHSICTYEEEKFLKPCSLKNLETIEKMKESDKENA